MLKKILIIGVFILLLATVAFLLSDRFAYSSNVQALKKINISISDLAGIGALITSIVGIITIYEIKRQRQHTYKPDVYLDSYTALLYEIDYWEPDQFFRYKKGLFNEPNNDLVEVKGIYLLYRLTNIGFGVAKNIECEWDFDLPKAVQMLKTVAPEKFVIDKNLDKIIEGYSIRNMLNGYQHFFYQSDLKSQHIDFVLPESVAANKKNHAVPSIITAIITYYLVFKYNLENPDPENEFIYEDFPDFPIVSLKLSYSDIGKKRHIKELKLTFTACGLLGENDRREEKEFGILYINVEEKY